MFGHLESVSDLKNLFSKTLNNLGHNITLYFFSYTTTFLLIVSCFNLIQHFINNGQRNQQNPLLNHLKEKVAISVQIILKFRSQEFYIYKLSQTTKNISSEETPIHNSVGVFMQRKKI